MNKAEMFIEVILWAMLSIGLILFCAFLSDFMYWQIVLTFIPPIRISESSYFYPECRGLFLFGALCFIIGACLLGDLFNKIWEVEK